MHKSGKLNLAKISLKTKAMRAFFGLKRTIIKSKLSFRALTTLFDSLIKPIVLYGAPIWTPQCAIIKTLAQALILPSPEVQNIIPKINRTVAEKMHLSFMKWALGVHHKTSNIGTWGESGRFPLIYQSIKLTLNYYNRLLKMESGSLVHAALQEQKKLNLQWYKNIESLLKLDDVYQENHVSAFRTNNPNSDAILISAKSQPRCDASVKLLSHLSSLRVAVPLPSKQFRTYRIIKALTNHFKNSWEHEKSTSPKLDYYHTIKAQFCKETYLDTVSNAKFRFRTTKLRISAHDLEVETGRYHGIPREERSCKWCLLSTNQNAVENETHLLFHCDLYTDLRSKITQTLRNSPTDTIMGLHISQNIIQSPDPLQRAFMSLLSPNTPDSLNEGSVFNQLHANERHIKDSHHARLMQLRYYISNALSSYIDKCFNKRWKFIEDLSAKSVLIADIAIVR